MAEQQMKHLVNGIDLDVLGETVEAIRENPELGESKFHIKNKWIGGGHNQTTVNSFYGAGQEIEHLQEFKLDADEPPVLAGGDKAANPVEHLLNALTSCMTTSIVCHAAVRGINIEELESEVEGDIDIRGFLGLSTDVRKGYRDIRVKFKVKTDENNLERIRRLAEFSPVYDVVSNGTNVEVQIERK
jgi:uncharacterized OsmC-like protein